MSAWLVDVLNTSQFPHQSLIIPRLYRRPKKKGADRRHKPAEYAPLPPPPAEYTVVSADASK